MKLQGYAVRMASCLFLMHGPVAAELNVSEPISAEEMATRAQASRSVQPASSKSAEGETRAIARASDDVLASSQILAANGQWTLVPKNAIVHVPKNLAQFVAEAPTGKMIPWADFLVANRSWLNNLEITMDEASGKTPINPVLVESWPKQGKIVVTTHKGGAISCNFNSPQS
jgi:hypothetical protein